MHPTRAILRYLCTICFADIRRTNAKQHIELHTSNNKCELCNFSHSDPDLLRAHVVNSHLEERYECPICGDIYANSRVYATHRRTHGEPLFHRRIYTECRLCGGNFYPQDDLEEVLRHHLEEHHDRSPEEGPLCPGDVQEEGSVGELVDALEENVEGEDTKENVGEDFGGNVSSDSERTIEENAGKYTGENTEGSIDIPSDLLTSPAKPIESITDSKCVTQDDSQTVSNDGNKEKLNDASDNLAGNTRKADDAVEKPVSSGTRKNDLKRKNSEINDGTSKAGKKRRKTKNTKKGPHVCKICQESYPNKKILKTHVLDHADAEISNNYHVCLHCHDVFKRRNHLRSHERLVHPENLFSCTHCSKKFKSKRSLKEHLEGLHGGLETVKDEGSNEVQEDSKKVYSCKVCSESFESAKELRDHKKSHGEEERNPVICDLCGKVLKTRSGLRLHHKTQHTDACDELCSVCGKTFKTAQQYHHHMKQHMDKFQCPTCERWFPSKQKMKGHMNKVGCHKCEVCGQLFRQRFNLDLHRSIHTGEKPHQCSECGKTFRTKYYLEGHLLVHRGEKRFQCPKCDWKFITSTGLNRHLRIHSGERPYMCSECGKSFQLPPNLTRHMNIHKGVKHECPICGRKITDKENLKKHMRVHEKRGETVPGNGVKAAPVVGAEECRTDTGNVNNATGLTVQTTQLELVQHYGVLVTLNNTDES